MHLPVRPLAVQKHSLFRKSHDLQLLITPLELEPFEQRAKERAIA